MASDRSRSRSRRGLAASAFAPSGSEAADRASGSSQSTAQPPVQPTRTDDISMDALANAMSGAAVSNYKEQFVTELHADDKFEELEDYPSSATHNHPAQRSGLTTTGGVPVTEWDYIDFDLVHKSYRASDVPTDLAFKNKGRSGRKIDVLREKRPAMLSIDTTSGVLLFGDVNFFTDESKKRPATEKGEGEPSNKKAMGQLREAIPTRDGAVSMVNEDGTFFKYCPDVNITSRVYAFSQYPFVDIRIDFEDSDKKRRAVHCLIFAGHMQTINCPSGQQRAGFATFIQALDKDYPEGKKFHSRSIEDFVSRHAKKLREAGDKGTIHEFRMLLRGDVRPKWLGLREKELLAIQGAVAQSKTDNTGERLIAALAEPGAVRVSLYHKNDPAWNKNALYHRMADYLQAVMSINCIYGHLWYFRCQLFQQKLTDGKLPNTAKGQEELFKNALWTEYDWSEVQPPRWLVRQWEIVREAEQDVPTPHQWATFERPSTWPDSDTNAFMQRLNIDRARAQELKALKHVMAQRSGLFITAQFMQHPDPKFNRTWRIYIRASPTEIGIAKNTKLAVPIDTDIEIIFQRPNSRETLTFKGKTHEDWENSGADVVVTAFGPVGAEQIIGPAFEEPEKADVEMGEDSAAAAAASADTASADAEMAEADPPVNAAAGQAPENATDEEAEPAPAQPRYIPVKLSFPYDPTSGDRQLNALDGLFRSELKRAKGVDIKALLFNAPDTIDKHGILQKTLTPAQKSSWDMSLRLRQLDEKQLAAAKAPLWADNDVTILHAPPGAGKTWTGAALAEAAVRAGERPMVVGSSNYAIDAHLSTFKGAQATLSTIEMETVVRWGGDFKRVKVPAELPEEEREAIVAADQELQIATFDLAQRLQERSKSENKDLGWGKLMYNWLSVSRGMLRAGQMDKEDPVAKMSEKYFGAREWYFNPQLPASQKQAARVALVQAEKEAAELFMSRRAKIVFSTANSAGDDCLVNGFKPTMLIVEEVGQGDVPDLAVAFSAHRETVHSVFMSGDYLQLQPQMGDFNSNEAVGVSGISLFTAINADPFKRYEVNRLDTQRRMHPDLADFIGHMMYTNPDGTTWLKSADVTKAETEVDRLMQPFVEKMKDKLGYNGNRLIAAHVDGESYTPEDTHTKANDGEAQSVVDLLVIFEKLKIPGKKVLVLTPYSGQSRRIQEFVDTSKALPRAFRRAVKVQSIQQCQGGENDVVILSHVSHRPDLLMKMLDCLSIGYIKKPGMLNVGHSRARRWLFVLGNFANWLKALMSPGSLPYQHLHEHNAAKFRFMLKWVWDKDLAFDCKELVTCSGEWPPPKGKTEWTFEIKSLRQRLEKHAENRFDPEPKKAAKSTTLAHGIKPVKRENPSAIDQRKPTELNTFSIKANIGQRAFKIQRKKEAKAKQAKAEAEAKEKEAATAAALKELSEARAKDQQAKLKEEEAQDEDDED